MPDPLTPLEYGRPPPRQSIFERLGPGLGYRQVGIRLGVGLAVGLGVLIWLTPETNLQREMRHRRECATHFRQIGAALRRYCDDHGDAYPDTLATLIRREPTLAAATLVCHYSEDTPAAGPTADAVADAVAAGGHCSYRYAGRGLTAASASASTVVLYEPAAPSVGHEDGCNVLWGDGHVSWVDLRDAAAVLPAGAVGPWVPPTTWPTHGQLQIR